MSRFSSNKLEGRWGGRKRRKNLPYLSQTGDSNVPKERLGQASMVLCVTMGTECRYRPIAFLFARHCNIYYVSTLGFVVR